MRTEIPSVNKGRRQAPQPHPWHFSRHAAERLHQRDIALTPQQLNRLFLCCETLRLKPGRKAVVLLDQWVFIVDVRKGMVITAVERQPEIPQIFTEVDSMALA